MTYQEMSDLYRGSDRGRYEICVRQQGYIFSADGRPDIAELGKKIVAGNQSDIDAVIAAICVSPSWAELDDDQALLSSVQTVWPTVASSLYGTTAGE